MAALMTQDRDDLGDESKAWRMSHGATADRVAAIHTGMASADFRACLGKP